MNLWTAKIASHDSSVQEFPFERQPTVRDLVEKAGLSAEGLSIKIDGEPAANGLDTLVRSGGVVYLHPKTDGGA
jgi:hypothetical protein